MENNPFNNFNKFDSNIEHSETSQIENLRKEVLNFFSENQIYFDKVEKREENIKQVQSLGALKKIRNQLKEYLTTIDKEKNEKADMLRQKMFQLIAEQNIIVDKDLLRQIATQNHISELKHLMYKLKEKYNLNFHDLENTVDSVKTISGGLYGLGKSRKH